MTRKKQDDPRRSTLDEILASASDAMSDEYVVFRGQLIRSSNNKTFLLNLNPSTNVNQILIETKDVVDDVMTVSANRLRPYEICYTVHEIKVRVGAKVRLLRNRKVRIGDQPIPSPTFNDRKCFQAVEPRMQSLNEALKAAPDEVGEESIILRGMLVRSEEKGSFMLQPDPSTKRDWAIIRKKDILNADTIEHVPKAALAPHERGFRMAYVRIRYGATLRLVRTKVATVGVTPLWTPAKDESVQIGHDNNSVGTEPQPLASTGTCKTKTGVKKVCDGKTVKGVGCASPGSTCEYGLFSGTCTTECHWFWGIACDCDL